jgi:DNA-binding MarR family transcriptional regulator
MERHMANPQDYLRVISQMERAHSQFLSVIKLELDGLGIHDINNVQALMLFNIGSTKMSMGELALRGCYHGSNASYNVKKMVENGYLTHERSLHDRRSCHIGLTEKGVQLRDRLMVMHQRHLEFLAHTTLMTDEDLAVAAAALDRLERTWLQHTGWSRSTGKELSSSLLPPAPIPATSVSQALRELASAEA